MHNLFGWQITLILVLLSGLFFNRTLSAQAEPTEDTDKTSATTAPAVARQNRMAGVRPNSVAQPLPATQAEKLRGMRLNQLADDARRRFIYIREVAADGRLEKARRLLVDYLIVYPESIYKTDARTLLGNVLRDQGHLEQAALAYEQAFLSAPDQARGLESYLKAGRLYARLGQHERARRVLREIIRKRPSSPQSRQAELALRTAPLVDLDGRDLRGQADQIATDRALVDRTSTDRNDTDRRDADGRDADTQVNPGDPTRTDNSGANTDTGVTNATAEDRTDPTAAVDTRGATENRNPGTDSKPEPGSQAIGDGPLDLMGEGVEHPDLNKQPSAKSSQN